MVFKFKYLLLPFILLSIIFSILFAAEVDFNTLILADNIDQYEGLKIKEIKTRGNLVLTDEQIVEAFPIKVGEEFSKDIINDAIRILFATDSYDRIAIDTEVENNEIILTIVIDERPIIKDINFIGNKKVNRGDLLGNVRPFLEIGNTYLPQNLNNAVNSIITNYQDKGYLKAYVNPKVIETKDKSYVTIEMNIEEGNEVKVARIKFYGITQFSDNELKSQMGTKENGFMALGKFNEFKFEEDKQKILKYYKDRGYYYAKIENVKFNYQWRDPQKKNEQDLIINIYIEEGEKYYFGNVSFKGNYVLSNEEIQSGIKAKKGNLYNYSIYMTDFYGIQQKYSERGYIFRQVIPVINVDEDTKMISIMYDIIENDKAHIERINIAGNTKTKDFVIERYIDIEPGEVFNSAKIQRVQERLNNTRFFDDIGIGVKPGSAEGLMELTFNVTEGRTAVVSGGGGYSTSSGFSIFAEVTELNFLGYGLQLGIKGEFGEEQKSLGVNFAEPYLFNLPIYFGVDVSYFNENVNTGVQMSTDQFGFPEYSFYTRHGFEGILRFGYYFFDYFSTFLSFNTLVMQYQQSSKQGATDLGASNVIHDVNKFLSTRIDSKNGEFKRWQSDWFTTFIVSYSVARDSRNDYLNPTKGSFLRLSSDFYFGHSELSRLTATGFLAVPLAKWISLAFYGEIGQIIGNPFTGTIKNDGDILYYLNPFEDIRGWDTSLYTEFKKNRGLSTYNSIGVNTDGTSYTNQFSYGRAQIRFFAEARIPIIPKTLSFATFFDLGQLWLPYSTGVGADGEIYPNKFIGISDIFDPSQYMYSVGAGLRLTIPIFNIRVYVAKRFVYEKGVGFRDFELDGYSPLGAWLGKGWSIAFTMNHPFY